MHSIPLDTPHPLYSNIHTDYFTHPPIPRTIEEAKPSKYVIYPNEHQEYLSGEKGKGGTVHDIDIPRAASKRAGREKANVNLS